MQVFIRFRLVTFAYSYIIIDKTGGEPIENEVQQTGPGPDS